MKKILSGILAAIMTAGVCALATSCGDTIKNGSKIEKCTVTFDVGGTEEAIDFELYMNIAPSSIAHFKYLAEKGFYNGSAVSDVASFITFGETDKDYKSLDDKYSSIINDAYVKSLKQKEQEMYTSKFTLVGEFENNGFKYEGTSLDLSDGALVLKRAIDDDGDLNRYDTAKGAVSVTFGSSSYYGTAASAYKDFVIFGKADKNDASGDKKSSYTRVKAILEDYKKGSNDEKIYYFAYEPEDTDDNKTLIGAIGDYGRDYMVEADGETFVKDASGAYTVKVTKDTEKGEAYLNAIENNAKYVVLRPSKEITIKSITFSK